MGVRRASRQAIRPNDGADIEVGRRHGGRRYKVARRTRQGRGRVRFVEKRERKTEVLSRLAQGEHRRRAAILEIAGSSRLERGHDEDGDPRTAVVDFFGLRRLVPFIASSW